MTVDLDATRVFRVLAIDDHETTLEEIEDQLDPLGIEVIPATTAAMAIEILDRQYIDAAIVDILLKDVEAGREVLRQMRHRAPAAATVIASAYTDNLGEFIGIDAPQLLKIVHKDPMELPEDWAVQALRKPFEDWQARAVRIENIELAIRLLEKRRDRLPQLREGEELACEIDRLFRLVFGAATDPTHDSSVTVELRPIRREGLSPAATVEANVSFARDLAEKPVDGTPVVVKIAGRDSTLAEADAYHRYVKYGVPLLHRVELLGHAADRALGVACYSFASRKRELELETLDEQFALPERAPYVRRVLDDLFDESARSWYAVTTRPASTAQYFARSYGLDLVDCQDKLDAAAKAVERRVGTEVELNAPTQKDDGELRIGRARLLLPRKSIWGDGVFVKKVPTCLVHGDMQGGNVMMELDHGELERVCLIDYANAGPGPRLVDILALEASMRLGDAHSILAGFGVEREQELDDESYRRAAMRMAERVEDEATVLSAMWDPLSEEHPALPDWALPAMQLSLLAHTNFEELAESEYIAVALPTAFRHFTFHISKLARIRLAAWISAVYARYEP
jgi:CheY-like chemotaxis protein